MGGAKRDIVLPSYVIPIAVGVLVVVSVIALPKFLSRGVEPSSPASKTTKARAVTSGTEEQPSNGDVSRNAKSNSSSSSSSSRDALKNSAAAAAAKEIPKPPAASPSPATLRSETKPAADSPANSASASGSAPGRGEVLDQILPDVPDKALSTITGKVRVAVRAHVDPAGNVSDAEFEDPGPSEYFAKAAMKAVRRWEFTPPEVGGRTVPSEWLVRFEFALDGVKAFPKQVTP